MVSVPREQLRQFIEYSASICKSPAWVKDKAALLAAIDQPAQQHQVKPVAYRWKQLGGNGYMYGEQLPAIVLGVWQELYAGADAGEVERLVAANTEYARRHLELQGEVERLRQEVASIDKKLRGSDEHWNGEGLPQAGDECEARIGVQKNWRQVKIKFIGDEMLVAQVGDKELCWRLEYCTFRPVRTPEQIAADERAAAIEEMWATYWKPEVQTAFEGLGLLYDAGYRKQVQP